MNDCKVCMTKPCQSVLFYLISVLKWCYKVNLPLIYLKFDFTWAQIFLGMQFGKYYDRCPS